jgi:XTP/dITP diphosphohydrolase
MENKTKREFENIVFATTNSGKLSEAKLYFEPLGYKILGLSDIGVKRFEAVENGKTFSDNARIKALALYKLIHEKFPEYAVLADDSGLEVNALDNRPGVFSARYAGENATDLERCEKILKEMENIPEENRGAKFVCAVVYISPTFSIGLSGACGGKILPEMRGGNGFGYDPIFAVKGETFAEMSAENKLRYSHRGAALRQLAKFLDERERHGATSADIRKFVKETNEYARKLQELEEQNKKLQEENEKLREGKA